jgi:hypothetical protein
MPPTTVGPTAVKSTSMGAASKARLPAGGKASDISAVIKATERAGTCTRLSVRSWSPMESWISASRSAPVERVAMVKIAAVVIEVVAIDDRAAVGDVGVVVVNRGATVPIIIPVMPAPPKSAEEADSKTTAKVN